MGDSRMERDRGWDTLCWRRVGDRGRAAVVAAAGRVMGAGSGEEEMEEAEACSILRCWDARRGLVPVVLNEDDDPPAAPTDSDDCDIEDGHSGGKEMGGGYAPVAKGEELTWRKRRWKMYSPTIFQTVQQLRL